MENEQLAIVDEIQNAVFAHKERVEHSIEIMEMEIYRIRERCKKRMNMELDAQAKMEMVAHINRETMEVQ